MATSPSRPAACAVLNTNDLARGLKRISDDQRGYYVIGYTPPEGTFAAPGKTPRFHQVSVKVSRPGLRVRTRKGFSAMSDADRTTAEPHAAAGAARRGDVAHLLCQRHPASARR